MNLLLVDDHTLVTDGLKALLGGDERYTIKATASNGKEALDILHILKIDVVLLDIDMPVLNGIKTAKIIKEKMPEVKIIMLTMHDEYALAKTLMDLGVEGYLLKNSSKQVLTQALEHVWHGDRFFSEEIHSTLMQKGNSNGSKLLSSLTEREKEIIGFIAQGLNNKEIGEKLHISHRTVDTHRTNLMAKLDLHNVAGIVRFAIQNGMV